MRTLFVIGGGGREHAVVWHLARHYPGATIYCAPGNPGIARLATCLPLSAGDLDGLADAVARCNPDLVVVGPEAPLVGGLADRLQARGLRVLGPTAAAARIEGSKAFAKQLMARAGVPTAPFLVFDDPRAAVAHARRLRTPAVVKADGLAAGKGVVVCDGPDEVEAAIRAIMVDAIFGDAGRRVVIEERLVGQEVSAFALVDGEAVAWLGAAQDHKRLQDGDRGPNTGGMGAVAPYPISAALRARIVGEILQPVASALASQGCPYRGVLFAGLMLTAHGPRVLEFNCRLGDPEAQVLLPLLRAGLPDAFDAVCRGETGADGRLAGGDLTVSDRATCGVVLASGGYPASTLPGVPIAGVEEAAGAAVIFHNGTAEAGGRLVTAGGRVLTVVGQGPDVAAARARAYAGVAQITFEGMRYRTDIGARLLATVSAGGG
ncbi:MAG: phosphoribosylamine--glycine ligase [Armatimonadota bacterium]|nr:phosphoribosylamine--glycine ligase [Armatimonadota bacterium]MDR7533587.1 phosphoribosylamine--glycine ligase [Armatimonadota bacterium]MDR7537387.1 phosphoribosylamine--glycine ligase [Armatimonadota bacterium]